MRVASLLFFFAASASAQPGLIPNDGQWDPAARYLARLDGVDVWVTDAGLRFDAYEVVSGASTPRRPDRTAVRRVRGEVVDVALAGIRRAGAPVETRVSYFGADARRHAAGLQPASVLTVDADGATIELRARGGRLELAVDAVTREALAATRLAGAALRTGAGGDLVLSTSIGDRAIGRLSVSVGGAPRRAGRLLADGTLAIGDALVRTAAGPGAAVVYSTFLGGGAEELADNVRFDAAGRTVIAGQTISADFPTTPGAYDGTLGGTDDVAPDDVFVVRLSADGATLDYATFLGGSDAEITFGMALDADDGAVVTGTTYSDDFPVTPGAFQTENRGGGDVFVARLSPDGTALSYATLVGGTDVDAALGIVVAPDGAVVLSGTTNSPDLPTTPGAFDQSYNGTTGIYGDAFVTRIAPGGGALVYSTFVGGPGEDISEAVGLDADGRVYLIGNNSDGGFPTTDGAFDRTYNGGFFDAFAARLSADGSTLEYGTYLGSSEGDFAFELAVAADSRLVITGATSSSGFPTTPGAYDRTLSGAINAFVAVLSADGRTLEASTFVGGSGQDNLGGVAIDASGRIVIVGSSSSADFPTTPGAASRAFGGVRDAVVVRLAPDLSALDYGTYLGSTGEDAAVAVALRGDEAVVLGTAGAADFPTTPGAYDTSYNGQRDVFATRLRLSGTVASEPQPEASALSRPFPNPTAGRAEMTVDLPSAAVLRAEVVDVLGRTVAVLADGAHAAGPHALTWDTSGVASGSYIIRVTSEGPSGPTRWTRRVTVVR